MKGIVPVELAQLGPPYVQAKDGENGGKRGQDPSDNLQAVSRLVRTKWGVLPAGPDGRYQRSWLRGAAE